jgi:hypothetical protein
MVSPSGLTGIMALVTRSLTVNTKFPIYFSRLISWRVAGA